MTGGEIGGLVAPAFGVLWTLWGASGLAGTTSGVIRALGVIVGVAMVVAIVCLRSERPPTAAPSAAAPAIGKSGSMFASRGYLVVTALEVVVIGVGNRLLSATGHPDYVIAWVALVVGIHFLALGRLFFPGFYWLGAGMVVAGLFGAGVGAVGGGAAGVKAASGLTAAASVFASGAWTVADQLRTRRRSISDDRVDCRNVGQV
jgi:hypothetical protein